MRLGLRAVVEIADALIDAEDEDSMYRLAVELVRKRLGFERVGIFVYRDPWVFGTFGTDYKGRTTDERSMRVPIDEHWSRLFRIRRTDEPHWDVSRTPLRYWDGRTMVGDRRGWLAMTPIQTARKSIGVLCNDNAITGRKLDETNQGVLAVFASLLANIAERRAAEKDRGRLAAAVDQAVEAIMITDVHGVIQYVNPGFERMTGHTREYALGKTPSILKSGRHPPSFYARMWRVLLDGGVWSGRMTNRRKDGLLCEVDVNVSPVRNKAGEIVSFLSVAQDVTNAVRLETELRQAQKMESLGRLAGGIAHDFNNLLTAILGFARIVHGQLGVESPMRKDMEEILRSGERATRLSRQLLAFGRKEVVHIQPMDLNQVVLGMQGMLRRTLGGHIELVLRLHENLGAIEADSGQIEQIILNLAINSRDAMPGGGVLKISTDLRAMTADDVAQRSHLREGEYVRMIVADNGAGMPDHVKEHAFEPFYTTKEKAGGSGLGLATVYGIVRQARGHIELRHREGGGTEVEILFPRSLSSVGQAQVPRPRPELKGGSETILVAEDEAVVRRLTVRLLQSLGYTVIEAANGEEAMEAFRRCGGRVDLLLTDVMMPKMGGPDLVRALRAIQPGLRALFMSGFAEDVVSQSGGSQGSISILLKPFTREAVDESVRHALDSGRGG